MNDTRDEAEETAAIQIIKTVLGNDNMMIVGVPRGCLEILLARLNDTPTANGWQDISSAELDADLIEILGKPNFACAPIAHWLRQSGQSIERKSEHEQAAEILFLTKYWIKYGKDWKVEAQKFLNEISPNQEKTMHNEELPQTAKHEAVAWKVLGEE